MAEASVERPDGMVRDVIFPAVGGERVPHELVSEYKDTGPGYRRKFHQAMRRLYQAHYRRLLPPLLDTLEFHSNNDAHQPIIQAVELLRRYVGGKASNPHALASPILCDRTVEADLPIWLIAESSATQVFSWPHAVRCTPWARDFRAHHVQGQAQAGASGS